MAHSRLLIRTIDFLLKMRGYLIRVMRVAVCLMVPEEIIRKRKLLF